MPTNRACKKKQADQKSSSVAQNPPCVVPGPPVYVRHSANRSVLSIPEKPSRPMENQAVLANHPGRSSLFPPTRQDNPPDEFRRPYRNWTSENLGWMATYHSPPPVADHWLPEPQNRPDTCRTNRHPYPEPGSQNCILPLEGICRAPLFDGIGFDQSKLRDVPNVHRPQCLSPRSGSAPDINRYRDHGLNDP